MYYISGGVTLVLVYETVVYFRERRFFRFVLRFREEELLVFRSSIGRLFTGIRSRFF